ncbi:aminotransferase class V-fold PLP-dependent enzyme [Luedemannella helvata]|uniref:Aminotransferase class V-fold PLP-dependent enzyme n=1 Tax=Luedemannella helvata TaxID=349315 RepID=A0ABP4VYA7_9ACTN
MTAPSITPTALLSVVGTDARVPLVDGGETRYTNLDYAASAPALATVAEHVGEVLASYASVHRGAGYLSRVCTALYEDARAAVTSFVGARGDDVVVFTRHTTDAFGLLASATPGEAVLLDIEHHANLLPWQRRGDRVLAARPTLAATLDALEAELRRRPAALVTVTGASNVTGERTPLPTIADIAHRHGARLAVDGAQLAPHRPIDLAGTGVDYLAFSGHKLYAPYGAGVLVGRRDWLDAAEPYLAGGGAVTDVTVAATAWAPAPARHEAGTPNVVGVAALARACRELAALPAGALVDHEHHLRERLVDGLAALGITPLRLWPDSPGAVGLVAFTVDGVPAGKVAAYLSAEHGIGVRDGRFCAHPLLDRLGVPAAVRASFGVGSTVEDVDRLLSALGALSARGTQWAYAQDSAGWAPVPETRRLPDWLGGAPLSGEQRPCDGPVPVSPPGIP